MREAIIEYTEALEAVGVNGFPPDRMFRMALAVVTPEFLVGRSEEGLASARAATTPQRARSIEGKANGDD